MKDIVILVLLLNSTFLQSRLTALAIDIFAKVYDLNLEVDEVVLRFPNVVKLRNVTLSDCDLGPLVKADELRAYVGSIDFSQPAFFIDNVTLTRPVISLLIDSAGNANYACVLKKFASEEADTSPTTMHLRCKNLAISNGTITFVDQRYGDTLPPMMINPYHLCVSDLNIGISDIVYKPDTIAADLQAIHLLERSGFNLLQLAARLCYTPKSIEANDLIVKTNNSLLRCPSVNISGDDENYLSDYLKMKANVDIDTLRFDLHDLKYIDSQFAKVHDVVSLSGNFSGRFSNFKFKNFNVKYGNDTRLLANLSINGLPEADNSFMFGDISDMHTTDDDIERFVANVAPTANIVLPKVVKDLGEISFAGNITGMLNDMVAYGDFKTNVGTVKTDLALVTDFDKKLLAFHGRVGGKNIDLGTITSNADMFGNLDFRSTVNGYIDSADNYNAVIDCNIERFNFMKYDYNDISFNGEAVNGHLECDLNSLDPNMLIEIFFKYDFSKADQQLKLYTRADADLSATHLLADTLNGKINFALSSELHGDILNYPQGSISLLDLNFHINQSNIKLDKLFVKNVITNDKKQYLSLRSDYFDISLWGKYKYSEIATDIYNMAAHYIPSVLPPTEIPAEAHKSLTHNDIHFDFKLKNMNHVVNKIFPTMDVHELIMAEGSFNSATNDLEVMLNVPMIKYDSIYLWGTDFAVSGDAHAADVMFSVQEISSKTSPLLENLNFGVNMHNDSVAYNLSWDNYDSVRNAGNIKLLSAFVNDRPGRSFPKIENVIRESAFIIKNNKWTIRQTPITIDSTEITIQQFVLAHDNQKLQIDGAISENESKKISLLIQNLDVSSLNPLIESSGFTLDGTMSGNGRFANVYKAPRFRSNISIANFAVNKEDFGRFDLSLNWDGGNKGFKIDGVNKYMKVKGDYTPATDSIDVQLLVNKFKLPVLQPYLQNFELSNIAGTVDVYVGASGTMKKPSINGNVIFNRASLVYDYLKLKANFSDTVFLTNDSVAFRNFTFYDDHQNHATIQGGICHHNFSKLQYDFLISAYNTTILNTREQDNSMFYGTANATGNVNIYGNADEFTVDVKAKTEKGTRIVLPMQSEYESNNISYLTFVKPMSDEEEEPDRLSQIAPTTKMNLQMDMEITPDAEVQVVFDPKVGDLIKGNGSGNLKLEYATDAEFTMYGEVEIEKGEYLFTLENIINKRFYVQKGGTLRWSGSPYDAVLDLNAIYNTKAPLKELMAEIADSSDTYNRPVNVECRMNMSGPLTLPEILFSINIPNAPDKAKAQLANLTQDEVNKQLLYLLIMGRFYSPNQELLQNIGNTTNAFGSTSAELLSNQISNWMSQLSKDFDFGFNYRPGTDLSGDQFDLAMSTQIINDRVLINGNVGIGTKTSSSNNIVGDIEVQFKVNKKGSFRIKGYTRANDELEAEYGPYTSGAGIFYTEDFDTFGNLMRKIWGKITFKEARMRRKSKLGMGN